MKFHMCMDVQGFMSRAKFPRDYRGMFKHDDGRSMTPDEARDQLFVWNCMVPRKGTRNALAASRFA